ncbi:MAG: ABC transporter permease [Chloroflexota bacterium]
MLPYGRLYRRFLILAFVRQAEYRVNFLLSVGVGLVNVVLAVLTFLLLYRFTSTVAGWTRAQVLLLLGVYRIVEGLVSLQVAPNLRALGPAIRSGDMDFLLLRPVSSQFLVSLRTLKPAELVNVFVGLALTVYAGNLAGVRWGVVNASEALLFGICGLIVLYAIWFLIVTCAFWLVQVDTLDELFYSVTQAAGYPVDFFRGGIRTLLTFVVPVAFATTFPAQALLGRADARLLPVGILLAAAALLATRLYWRFAVRSYSSASS